MPPDNSISIHLFFCKIEYPEQSKGCIDCYLDIPWCSFNYWWWSPFELAHEKRELMGFFVCCSSNAHVQPPVWATDTCLFAWSFLKVSTTCLWTAKALVRPMHRLARAFAGHYVITTLSCAGSFVHFSHKWAANAIQFHTLTRFVLKAEQLSRLIENDCFTISLSWNDYWWPVKQEELKVVKGKKADKVLGLCQNLTQTLKVGLQIKE